MSVDFSECFKVIVNRTSDVLVKQTFFTIIDQSERPWAAVTPLAKGSFGFPVII